MNGNLKILAFSGSLREKSFNTGLLRVAQEIGKNKNINIEILNVGSMPFYNADMEANFPPEISELKNKIRAADGVIFATPEYNRSVSGSLKNMLDWTSRPYGDSAWDGKKVAVIGASTGQVGTAVGQYHLKQILLYLDTHVMGQPEFYLSMAKDKFDAHGNLTDENTKEHLIKLLDKFSKFINS